jgi:hypothetical protein
MLELGNHSCINNVEDSVFTDTLKINVEHFDEIKDNSSALILRSSVTDVGSERLKKLRLNSSVSLFQICLSQFSGQFLNVKTL